MESNSSRTQKRSALMKLWTDHPSLMRKALPQLGKRTDKEVALMISVGWGMEDKFLSEIGASGSLYTYTSAPPDIECISQYGSAAIDTGESIYESIMKRIMDELGKKPIMQHRCNNCGATVEMDIDKHIFICRYCGSAYAIGTTQING